MKITRETTSSLIGALVINGTIGSVLFVDANGKLAQDNANLFWDDSNDRLGIGTISPYSGLHYQGNILYLTPAAGADSNDNITIKNYATGNGAPNIILRTADIDGAYGIGVGTLSLIGGSKTTHYGGIGGGGGEISLQGGQGRNASNNPSGYAPVSLQSNGGNVGIGTTEPGRNVEIYGSSPVLRLRDSGATASSTTAFIEFGGTDAAVWSRTGYIGDGSSGNTDIYLQAEVGDLHLGDSSGATAMNLQSGNVGIGTPTPDEKLQVVGAAKIGDDNTNYMEVGTTGDVVFVGGAGLCFADIYARDNTTTTSTSTTKTQILIFDTNGESNNMTPDHAQDHITVTKAGKYKIDASISIKNSSGSAHVISLEMYKNNGTGVFNNIHAGRTLGTGTDVGNLTMSGIVDLAANDTIEFWITSDSGSARTVTVEDIDFCAIQIGG